MTSPSLAHDNAGNPLTITRPNGAVTTMTYDAKGNLLTSTEPAIVATTTFTYEPAFHQVASITDPKNNLTTIAYDGKGNPLTMSRPLSKLLVLPTRQAVQSSNGYHAPFVS